MAKANAGANAKKHLDALEGKLSGYNKSAPQMSGGARKTLAGALWWLALVGGLLQLWAAYGFWKAWHYVDAWADWANQVSSYYGVSGVNDGLGFGFYLSLIFLVASAALLLFAVSPLKAFRKAGWNFLFYGLLLNVVYGVVRMFTDYGGFGDLFGALLGSVVGAYLLFQVRDYFKKA